MKKIVAILVALLCFSSVWAEWKSIKTEDNVTLTIQTDFGPLSDVAIMFYYHIDLDTDLGYGIVSELKSFNENDENMPEEMTQAVKLARKYGIVYMKFEGTRNKVTVVYSKTRNKFYAWYVDYGKLKGEK